MARRRRFRRGTVYCLRVRRRGYWWWIPRGYIGKTRYRDYRTRVDQHLFGYWYNGEWNPPKYWAADVVDYYPLWTGEHWSDWGLGAREMLCIRFLFPIHNVIGNAGNPRRVIPPPLDQRVYPTAEQITAVERYPTGTPRRPAIPVPPRNPVKVATRAAMPTRVYGKTFPYRRAVGAFWPVPWFLLAMAAILFIPGLPGANATVAGWDWIRGHLGEFGGGLIALGVAGMFTGRRPRRRTRRKRLLR